MRARAGDAARSASGACDGSSTPAPLGPLLELLPHLPADVWPPGTPRHEMFAREAGLDYCLERDLDTWWFYLQG